MAVSTFWNRRRMAQVGAACLSVCALGASAQGNYPTKPVRIVVGFSAGGTTDIVARIMARELTADLGQSFVVDNKPGAGSNIATELVAREVLARTLTPVFWTFVEHAFGRDEKWATSVRDHLQERCGRLTPKRDVIVLSREHAPAIADWLQQGQTLTLGDLIRRPDDREVALPLAALVLLRDGAPTFMPAAETTLALGDQVLLVGKPDGLSQVREICHYPSTVEYLATGRDVPLTWVWAKLTARSRRTAGSRP